VSSILDICSKQPWDIHDQNDVEEEIKEFRPQFEDNLQEDVPTHPYKIYRDIVESQELTEKERAALYHLKNEYSDKWKEDKRGELQ